MAETTEQAEQAGQLGALAEQIRLLTEKANQDAQRDEEMKKLSDTVKTLSDKLSQSDRKRGTDFIEDDLDRLSYINKTDGVLPTVKAMSTMKSTRPEVVELQRDLDHLYILGMLLSGEQNPSPDAIRKAARGTEYFKEIVDRNPMLRKAMDTTAGADWIPVDLSPDLQRQVRLQLRVAALFNRIPMPTNPFKLPIQGNLPTIYKVPEQGDADAEVTEAKKVTATSFAMTKRQLDAAKLGGRIVVSGELVEEAIVPMLEYIRSEIVDALSTAEEDVTLNGCAGGTLDSDSTGSTHRRTSWDGLRQVAKNAALAWFSVATAGRMEITDLRKLRMLMGKYALTPGESTILASPLGYTQLLGLTDASGNQLVLTRDKYGDRATLVTGEVAQLDGWPIVISGQQRDDLNRFGYYDGITTDSSTIMLVNRKQFIFGDYRRPTVGSKYILDTDQFALVVMERLGFLSLLPSEPAVGGVYGVRSV